MMEGSGCPDQVLRVLPSVEIKYYPVFKQAHQGKSKTRKLSVLNRARKNI